MGSDRHAVNVEINHNGQEDEDEEYTFLLPPKHNDSVCATTDSDDNSGLFPILESISSHEERAEIDHPAGEGREEECSVSLTKRSDTMPISSDSEERCGDLSRVLASTSAQNLPAWHVGTCVNFVCQTCATLAVKTTTDKQIANTVNRSTKQICSIVPSQLFEKWTLS